MDAQLLLLCQCWTLLLSDAFLLPSHPCSVLGGGMRADPTLICISHTPDLWLSLAIGMPGRRLLSMGGREREVCFFSFTALVAPLARLISHTWLQHHPVLLVLSLGSTTSSTVLQQEEECFLAICSSLRFFTVPYLAFLLSISCVSNSLS